MIPLQAITLGVLAGGRATRMGGADKAWIDHGGRGLLAATLDAFPQRFADRLVSARAADPRHEVLGVQAVLDRRPGYPGPVAGLEALACACRSAWLLSVPVDVDAIPPGLVDRLRAAAAEGQGACLRDADGVQPLLALWPATGLAEAAGAALDAGDVAARTLVASLRLVSVDIAPLRLRNLNTPDSLEECPR